MSDRATELRRQLAARLAALSPEERARLESAPAIRNGSGAAGIGRRSPGATIPLTHAQELLWLLDHTNPDLAAYNVPGVYRLEGNLDVAALKRALDALVERHESLRSAFVLRDGIAVQEVRPARAVPLTRVDLRGVPPEERDEAVAMAVSAATRAPLALEGGLLLQATIVQVEDDDQILVLSTHHIVSDAWSMRLLERDLAQLYAGFRAGELPVLPAVDIQFGDYAVWERGRVTERRIEQLVSYWRGQIGDASPQLDIPTDHPRPNTPRFEGARRSRLLDPETGAALARAVASLGATRFQILLAGFHALLARVTEQEDLIVAVPMAERHRPELQEVIGYLVNTLPIRARTEASGRFTDLVDQVRIACLAADEHRELPIEMMRSRVGERALQLQTCFTVTGGQGSEPFGLAGMVSKPVAFDRGWAKFELSLSIQDRPGELRATLEYRTDLFDAATADRLLEQYETLLLAALRSPESELGALPLLTEAERQVLLYDRNATEIPWPSQTTLHDLVRKQSRLTPDAVAVAGAGCCLTFAELEARSDLVAERLRSTGIVRGDRVGICMPRIPDLVAGLLGILKSGAAYVPLDPAYPVERLAFILEDTTARAVLVHPETSRVLPPHSAPMLDMMSTQADEGPPAAVSPGSGPEDTAYLIYTSGSTGLPKGVEIRHRNVVSFIAWARTVFSAGQLAGVLAGTSICFDLSVFEIFVTLCSGGTVLLVEDALRLAEAPAGFPVTLVNTVPSIMAELLQSQALPESIRTVNLAGEPLSPSLVEQIYRDSGVAWVYDLYGPSETTTYSTFTLRASGAPASIGRPVGNTQVFVLDRRGEPVPRGVPGELYIGGAGVAKGYLNRPELTAQRFLPNPFRPGERFYRTGDRVRWAADGNLEYLGRLDHLVKLRGFRIELGEVESAILRCPGVSATVAVVREDRPGHPILVAYCVPATGASLDVAALRAAIQRHLPAHAVPGHFVVLAALPLTQNGKVDRKALPAPEAAPLRARVEPRNKLEQDICAIWSEVLGVAAVGIDEDLFELGGHSLLAMRIASRLRQLTGVKVTLPDILSRPTVGGFAEFFAGIAGNEGGRARRTAASLRSVAESRKDSTTAPAPAGPEPTA